MELKYSILENDPKCQSCIYVQQDNASISMNSVPQFKYWVKTL